MWNVLEFNPSVLMFWRKKDGLSLCDDILDWAFNAIMIISLISDQKYSLFPKHT